MSMLIQGDRGIKKKNTGYPGEEECGVWIWSVGLRQDGDEMV